MVAVRVVLTGTTSAFTNGKCGQCGVGTQQHVWQRSNCTPPCSTRTTTPSATVTGGSGDAAQRTRTFTTATATTCCGSVACAASAPTALRVEHGLRP